ncbi:MAG: ribonuclease HII [Alphaproteobacteria bacterium]|nr:ribonuclease HII [Alphaproteobacteria bacterium]
MPDFVLEQRMGGRVAGVDEAGRGPWAGPVVAAATVIDPNRFPENLAERLDDSKKLRPKLREFLFDEITAVADVSVGTATPVEIDQVNILQATMLAMQRAVAGLRAPPDAALIDGNRAPDLLCPAETVIKGDGRCLSIAAASIIAKVTRDRMMAALAREHPGYGWERNAGYGTAEHRAALDRLGVTPHHRRSFAPVAIYCK